MYSVKYLVGDFFRIKKFLKIDFAKEFCKTKQNPELYLEKPLYKGWIYKKGEFNKSKKLRFLVLTKVRLIYYDIKEDTSLIKCGEIPLLSIQNISQYKTSLTKLTFTSDGRKYEFNTYNCSSDELFYIIRNTKEAFRNYVFRQ